MGKFGFGLVALLVLGALIAGPLWLAHEAGDEDVPDGIRVEQGEDVRRQYEALAAAGVTDAGGDPSTPGASDVPMRDEPAPAPQLVKSSTYLVLDEAGEPIPGIRASLSLLPEELAGRCYRPALANASWSSYLPVGDPLAEAVSDDGGELHFKDIPRNRRVRIDIAAWLRYGHATLLDTTAYVRTKTITLRPVGPALQLRIDGLPAHQERACVIVRSPWAPTHGGGVITQLWASCIEPLEDDGMCVTPPLHEGPLVADVVVPDLGVWRHLPIVRDGPNEAHAQIPTVPTLTLRGRLLGPDGTRVVGARLTLSVRAYLPSGSGGAWLRPAVSDAAGRFVFKRVPVGVVDTLHIEADGFVSPRRVLRNAPLRPDEDLNITLQLVPATSVVGRVLDGEGRPRVGARVRAHPRGGVMVMWAPGAAWTDEQGRFCVDGLPPGAVELECSAEGEPGNVRVKAVLEHGVVVRAPDAILAAAPNRGRIAVVVIGPDGEPVAGAHVAYRLRKGNMSGQIEDGTTRADGTYTIDGIQSDVESLEVWAHRRGAVSGAVPVSPAAAAARTASVRIELPPVGRIVGRVLEDGAPAAHVDVLVVGTRKRGRTNYKGVFRIEGVPPGEHPLQLRLASGADVGTPRGVSVRPDATLKVTLELERPKTGIALRGRLVDGAGRPWGLVALAAHGAEGGRAAGRGRTDVDGHFVIAVARRGSYRIQSGKRVLAVGFSPDEASSTVVLDPAAIPFVQGHVVGHDGARASGSEVHVTHNGSGRHPECHVGGGFFRMELDMDQTSALTLVAPHGYHDAWGRAVKSGTGAMPFAPGDTVVIRGAGPRAEKKASPAIVGFVVDEAGRPLPGARLWRVEGNGSRRSTVGSSRAPDGRFSIPRPPDGEYLLHVEGPPGYRTTRVPRRVRLAGGPVRITLPEVSPDEVYTVQVLVVDRDAQPVPSVPLTLRAYRHAASFRVTTGPDGRAVIPFVPRGGVEIDVGMMWRAKGYEGDARGADVEASPEQPDVTLTLPIRKRDPANEHDVWFHFRDAAGAVLPGAKPSVTLRGLGDRKDARYRLDRSPWGRESARVRARSVPAGRYRVQVGFSGHDAPYLPVRTFEIDVPRAPIDIALRRAAQLHGVVAGEDFTGFQVEFWTKKDANVLWRPLGAKGAFALNVDPADVVTVVVRRPDSDQYGVVTNATAADSPLRLVLDHKGLALRGRIEGHKPTEDGYTFTVRGVRVHRKPAVDSQGGFHLRGLPPGEYELDYSRWDMDAPQGAWEATVKAHAGAEGVVLRPK